MFDIVLNPSLGKRNTHRESLKYFNKYRKQVCAIDLLVTWDLQGSKQSEILNSCISAALVKIAVL